MAYPRFGRGINLSITNKLIIVNVLFYLMALLVVTLIGEEFFVENFALTPSLVLSGEKVWTLLTSMFAHVSLFHIFANMFSLFFVGNFLEKIIGSKRFIGVYLVSGLIGGIFFVASGIIFNDNTPGLGASGAVFGVLGVLATLVPYSKIYLILGPLLLILVYALMEAFVPASMISILGVILNILTVLMIFSLFSWNPAIRKFAVPVEMRMWLLPFVAIIPLVVIGFFVDLPIGNSAHIGGLVLGVLYGFYLRNKFPRKTKIISNYFR